MWLIALNFLKSKLGKQILIGLAISIALYSGYRYVFNKGVAYQKALYQTEYVTKLNQLLLEQKKAQEQAYKQGVEAATKEQKTITIYKDRVITVDKIIEKYKTCKMEDKDFTNYIDELKALK